MLGSDPHLAEAELRVAAERAIITEHAPGLPLAFAKPIRSRKPGEENKILHHVPWPLWDKSVFSLGRLVFCGAPTVRGAGLEVRPTKVDLRDGPELDTSLIKQLTTAEAKACAERRAEISGCVAGKSRATYERGTFTRDGRKRIASFVVTVPDLTMELELETPAGWRSVGDLLNDKAGHVRCQSPYRPDSTSWAAFFGLHGDGMPFIHDMGTCEKHVPDRTRLADGWKIIAGWLREKIAPSHVGRDGELVGRDGRAHRFDKMRPNPELLPELRLAANVPLGLRGNVSENKLPGFFKAWLPTAWEAVAQELPGIDEVDGWELSDEAVDELERPFLALLTALESVFGTHAPLAQGALTAAERDRGNWAQAEPFALWGRVDADGRLSVAFLPHVGGQLYRSNKAIAERSLGHLTRTVRQLGITEPGDNRIGAARAAVTASGGTSSAPSCSAPPSSNGRSRRRRSSAGGRNDGRRARDGFDRA
jgi:hypothetical protein